MTPKQERSLLKEIARVYHNCPERVATYTRWRWTATGTAWGLIFVAFFLSGLESVNRRLCMAIALLGGIAIGVSILLSTSARQIPLWVRYTTLRDNDLQERLEQLKDP